MFIVSCIQNKNYQVDNLHQKHYKSLNRDCCTSLSNDSKSCPLFICHCMLLRRTRFFACVIQIPIISIPISNPKAVPILFPREIPFACSPLIMSYREINVKLNKSSLQGMWVKWNMQLEICPCCIYSVSQKVDSFLKLFLQFFTQARYTIVKFCQFVVSLYPQRKNNFGRLILIFNKMTSIFSMSTCRFYRF